MSISEPIRVSCRIRSDSGDQSIVKASHPYVELLNPTNRESSSGGYKFDAVFDHQHTQVGHSNSDRRVKDCLKKILYIFWPMIFLSNLGSFLNFLPIESLYIGKLHWGDLVSQFPLNRAIEGRSLRRIYTPILPI